MARPPRPDPRQLALIPPATDPQPILATKVRCFVCGESRLPYGVIGPWMVGCYYGGAPVREKAPQAPQEALPAPGMDLDLSAPAEAAPEAPEPAPRDLSLPLSRAACRGCTHIAVRYLRGEGMAIPPGYEWATP